MNVKDFKNIKIRSWWQRPNRLLLTTCKYLGEVREPVLLKGVVIRYPVVLGAYDMTEICHLKLAHSFRARVGLTSFQVIHLDHLPQLPCACGAYSQWANAHPGEETASVRAWGLPAFRLGKFPSRTASVRVWGLHSLTCAKPLFAN